MEPTRGAGGRRFFGSSLLILLLGASSADAHIPRYLTGVFPADDERKLVLETNFGLLVSEDGGNGWRFICSEGLGASAGLALEVAALPTDQLLVVAGGKLFRSGNEACDWREVESFAETGALARDVIVSSGTAWVASLESEAFSLYRVADDFASVTRVEGAPPMSSLVGSGAFRLFGAGFDLETKRLTVYTSTNGGARFSAREIFPPGIPSSFRLLGADPLDGDTLLASTSSNSQKLLLKTDDGGQSFRSVLKMEALDSFFWSKDGRTILVGGRERSGLNRSVDGGETFLSLREEVDIQCAVQKRRSPLDLSHGSGDRFLAGGWPSRPTARHPFFSS